MGRLLTLILLAFSALTPRAATWTTDGSYSQVQISTLNNAGFANGDIITMPSGSTNYWPKVLTNTAVNASGVCFTLQGLGGPIVGVESDVTNQRRPTNYFNATPTVIFNNTASTLMNLKIPTNTFLMRLTGFTVSGVSTNMPADISAQPCIWLNGVASMFRVDHLDMQLVGETCFEEDGWINGVNDHINIKNAGYFGFLVDHQNWGGYSFGDGSWSSPRSFGTTNAIYLETCTLRGGDHVTSPGVYDMGEKGGGRVVLRNSYVECWNLGHHGTESSQRVRGGVQFEVYTNWFNNTNLSQPWFCANFVRSGTGVTFGNQYDGYDRLAIYQVYRTACGNGWVPWGNCDGTNAWDNTAGTIVATGTATGNSVQNGGQSIETNFDSNASFTPGQFVTSSGVYCILNTSAGASASAASIIDNGPTWIAYNINTPTSATEHFTIGQGYRIAGIVTNVLDMCGMGVADVVTNNGSSLPVNATIGGIVGWPHEVVTPLYSWSNTFHNDGNLFVPYSLGAAPCYTNVDFFDAVQKPAYTALVYPHPLVGPVPPPQQIARITGNLRVTNTKIGP